MAGHSPRADGRAVAAQSGARASPRCCRPRTRPGSARSWPPLRRAATGVRAHRDRRQPLGAALCRQITGRPKMLVFNWCYHGTVDETFVDARRRRARALARGQRRARRSTPRRRRGWPSSTTSTRVEAALAHGDVACVLTEPALTNIGIVLPEPGFLAALREACTRAGTLLSSTRRTRSAPAPAAARRPGASSPTSSRRQVDRRRRADRRLRRQRRGRPSGSRRTRTRTTWTRAAWAARWPATRCRSRPRARRSARC